MATTTRRTTRLQSADKKITTKTENGKKVFKEINIFGQEHALKFIPLPFYDYISTILHPTPLISTASGVKKNANFKFSIDSSHMKVIQKSESSVQIQLRLCQNNTESNVQKDCYPLDLAIIVNNKECALPPPIPVRPGQPIKRLPLPLNINSYMKLGSKAQNTIQVLWKEEENKKFAITVDLVNKLDTAILMQRLANKGTLHESQTRKLIRDKFMEETDNEISTTVLRVSLACPIGKMRMITPCRASTCAHLQCYDALTYLHMNEKKATWKCPVCDQPALFEDLIIDGYFLEVLKSCARKLENEIQLHTDGSWSAYSQEDETTRIAMNNNVTESIEIIDSDDDEVATQKLKHVKKKLFVKTECEEAIAAAEAIHEKQKSPILKENGKRRQARSDSMSSEGIKRVKQSAPELSTNSTSQNEFLKSADTQCIDLTLDDD